MAAPRRKKGFRPITVGGVEYRWRLELGKESGRLTIYGPGSSGGALSIQLTEWSDPWLNLNGFTVQGETLTLESSSKNPGEAISSGFVRRAIEAGLAAGWSPALRQKKILTYKGARFY